MIPLNAQALLYITHAALLYLLKAAEDGPRQVADIVEVTKRHVRVGVLEPGGVTTELGSHNTGAVREEIDVF
jgi:hypothetical protein